MTKIGKKKKLTSIKEMAFHMVQTYMILVVVFMALLFAYDMFFHLEESSFSYTIGMANEFAIAIVLFYFIFIKRSSGRNSASEIINLDSHRVSFFAIIWAIMFFHHMSIVFESTVVMMLEFKELIPALEFLGLTVLVIVLPIVLLYVICWNILTRFMKKNGVTWDSQYQ